MKAASQAEDRARCKGPEAEMSLACSRNSREERNEVGDGNRAKMCRITVVWDQEFYSNGPQRPFGGLF